MDWTGIIRELGMLAMNIQTDRFYALYLLGAVVVVLWFGRKH
jgi:hypothetical protein